MRNAEKPFKDTQPQVREVMSHFWLFGTLPAVENDGTAYNKSAGPVKWEWLTEPGRKG